MSAQCDSESTDLSFFVFKFDQNDFDSVDKPYTMSRKCTNSPNSFCCGEFAVAGDRCSITTNIKKLNQANFGIKLSDQDKSFAPHIAYISCTSKPRMWYNKQHKSLPFGVPMV